MIVVKLAEAVLCIASVCHPVLLGKNTPPPGEYRVVRLHTESPGYGGDVLMFHETSDLYYSIHRTWKGREKMYTLPAAKRRNISHGCINVEPKLYDTLITEDRLTIEP